jgi:hypothetical protein
MVEAIPFCFLLVQAANARRTAAGNSIVAK